MARPRKQETRAERLSLRLLPDERAALTARADSAGLGLSDYCRRLVTKERVTNTVVTRADPVLVLSINRIGVNLNQIAHALNSENLKSGHNFKPGLHEELQQTLTRVNGLLDQLQEAG